MPVAISPADHTGKVFRQPWLSEKQGQKGDNFFIRQINSKPLANPVKKNFFSKVNLQPLIDAPWNGAEGALWGGFCVLGAYFAADSLWKLHEKISDAAATTEKVGLAVKSVFVEFLSLVSSASYLARWANMSRILDLGIFTPIVNHACFGASGFANVMEAAEQVYQVRNRIEVIESGGPVERVEKHKKWLCYGLVKLAGHVNMIAWAVLGIAAMTTGIAVCSMVLPALLCAGMFFGGVAALYKYHLDSVAPIPELSEGPSPAPA